METMRDLEEIAFLIVTAGTVEEWRDLHELLRSTETEVDSEDPSTSGGDSR